MTRAHPLFQADAGLSDEAIAHALHIGTATVERICKHFVEEGLETALNERPRPGEQCKVDGRQEAFLIALACSTLAEGRQCGTMQILADKLMELRVIDAISDETVWRTLTKMPSSLGSRRAGVLPVGARSLYGAGRYSGPQGGSICPRYPLICFDEKLYLWVSESRQALLLRPSQPVRYDDEYRWEGTCNPFMCFEPLQGWRHIKVTDRRTAQDFAYGMQELVDVHFP